MQSTTSNVHYLKTQVDLFEKENNNNLAHLEKLNNVVTSTIDACFNDQTLDFDEQGRLTDVLCSLNDRIENLFEKIKQQSYLKAQNLPELKSIPLELKSTTLSVSNVHYLKTQVDRFEKENNNDLAYLEKLKNEVVSTLDTCFNDTTLDFDEQKQLTTDLLSLNDRIENLFEKIKKQNCLKVQNLLDLDLTGLSEKLHNVFNEKVKAIEKRYKLNYDTLNDIVLDRFRLEKLEIKIKSFREKYGNTPQIKIKSFYSLDEKISSLSLEMSTLIQKNWKTELAQGWNYNSIGNDQKSFDALWENCETILRNRSKTLSEENIDYCLEIAKTAPKTTFSNMHLSQISQAYSNLGTEQGCRKAFKLIHFEALFENKKHPSIDTLTKLFLICLEVKTRYTIDLARNIFDRYGDQMHLASYEINKLKKLEDQLDPLSTEQLYILKFENSPKNKMLNLWRGVYNNDSSLFSDSFPREIISIIFEKYLKIVPNKKVVW